MWETGLIFVGCGRRVLDYDCVHGIRRKSGSCGLAMLALRIADRQTRCGDVCCRGFWSCHFEAANATIGARRND